MNSSTQSQAIFPSMSFSPFIPDKISSTHPLQAFSPFSSQLNDHSHNNYTPLEDDILSNASSSISGFLSEINNSSLMQNGGSSVFSFNGKPHQDQDTLPSEFIHMTARSRNEVVAYSILFIIAATGNLTVFFSVYRQLTKLKWRITVLMLHLSIADLIVTFFLMPLEIFWRLTIQWIGGEALCKICQFFRAFGLYLSSNILICISLDRFIAILFPLRMVGATRRVKTMITVAWVVAGLSAAPQSVVFSVQAHPDYPTFKQCVSFGFFTSTTQEIMYNVFSVSAMYFVPLFTVIFTYSMILWKISSKVTEHQHDQRGQDATTPNNYSSVGQHRTRMIATQACSSDAANLLARAKKRTLRMTFVIVIVFVFCWTPYAVITLWYMFDKEGAKNLDDSLQDGLFMMAVANSCLNPIVYGNYTKKTAGPICSCFTFTSKQPRRRVISIRDGPYNNRSPNHKRTSSLLAMTSVI